MRYVLLVLLGLSLPALAQKAEQQQSAQNKPANPSSAVVDVELPCDPKRATELPPFN